jgi:hypothetical protein
VEVQVQPLFEGTPDSSGFYNKKRHKGKEKEIASISFAGKTFINFSAQQTVCVCGVDCGFPIVSFSLIVIIIIMDTFSRINLYSNPNIIILSQTTMPLP